MPIVLWRTTYECSIFVETKHYVPYDHLHGGDKNGDEQVLAGLAGFFLISFRIIF